MADSRDKPELETLSYRNKECPAKPSSVGFNSVVVKPEVRVNSRKVAGQPNQTRKGNIEGQNLMIIEEVEGLMSQVNEKIHKLTFLHNTSDVTKKQTLWSQAIEEIDLFQKTTLFELRKAFE